MVFVNGIRFTDEKKNRHDDDMEFDQVVLEYVDTWRRSIVIRNDSARQEWRYHEGIDVCTLNIFTKSKIKHITSSISDHLLKKKEFDFLLSHDEDLTLSDFALSLISTEVSKWKIPNRYQRIECPTQDRKFHQVIKNEVVQFLNSMNFNTFKNIYIYIYIYMHMLMEKYEYFLKLTLYNDVLWNRDFNYDINF